MAVGPTSNPPDILLSFQRVLVDLNTERVTPQTVQTWPNPHNVRIRLFHCQRGTRTMVMLLRSISATLYPQMPSSLTVNT